MLQHLPTSSAAFLASLVEFVAALTVEGLGLTWPGGDWALPLLLLICLTAALAAVRVLKLTSRRPAPGRS